MLETIAIILIVLWLLGMVSGYTLGNFIWVLLVVAVVLLVVCLINGPGGRQRKFCDNCGRKLSISHLHAGFDPYNGKAVFRKMLVCVAGCLVPHSFLGFTKHHNEIS